MTNSSGAVSVLGNGNAADYAIRSQILGTGNSLTGTEENISAYNTVSGFANSGTNVKRTAIVGTGNTLNSGEDNVVIGDYHQLEGGKHNVILGSMATEEKEVTKKQSILLMNIQTTILMQVLNTPSKNRCRSKEYVQHRKCCHAWL